MTYVQTESWAAVAKPLKRAPSSLLFLFLFREAKGRVIVGGVLEEQQRELTGQSCVFGNFVKCFLST